MPVFMIFRSIAALALLAASPVQARGATDSVTMSAEKGDEIFIPFAPPLNTKLAYRVTEIKKGTSRDRNESLIADISFARDGEDYLMTVIYRLPPSLLNQPDSLEALALTHPLVLRLNSDAQILAIENEDEYWVIVNAATKAAMSDDVALAEKILADMRSKPLENRLELIAKNVLPIVYLAATEHVVDEPVIDSADTETLIGNGNLTSGYIATLSSVADGIAQYEVHSTTSGSQVKGAAAAVVSDLGPKDGDPGLQQKADAALAKMELGDLDETQKFAASMATGLTKAYELRRTMAVPNPEGDGVTQIEIVLRVEQID